MNNEYIMYPQQPQHTSLQPTHSQHQPSTANKLKLLKKRNALKKTLSSLTKTLAASSANTTGTGVAVNSSASSGGLVKNGASNSYSLNGSQTLTAKTQFENGSRENVSKSQTNLNSHHHHHQHHQPRATSVHYSRNSLNAPEGMTGSGFHKSTVTIGGGETCAGDTGVAEHEDITDLKLNSFSSNLNRVRSTPHINSMNGGLANQGFGLLGQTGSPQKVSAWFSFTYLKALFH
jgi:hypothetical protein